MGHIHKNNDNSKRLFWALLLTAGFMVAEVVGGLLANSLALLADAGHMLTDSAALLLAFLAQKISARPADHKRSYGYSRFQVLAAFANGMALILIVIWILIEAIQRLYDAPEVAGRTMLVVAGAGLLVNILVFSILHRGDRDNVNIRGALLHVLGDLLGSVGAIVGALVILATGWMPIDPILSVLVSLLILRSAWRLVRESVHILLEGVPPHLDIEALKTDICARVPEVKNVHHVHAWSLSGDSPMLTLHAEVSDSSDPDRVLKAINEYLHDEYQIEHSTIQIEKAYCG